MGIHCLNGHWINEKAKSSIVFRTHLELDSEPLSTWEYKGAQSFKYWKLAEMHWIENYLQPLEHLISPFFAIPGSVPKYNAAVKFVCAYQNTILLLFFLFFFVFFYFCFILNVSFLLAFLFSLAGLLLSTFCRK